MSTKDGVIAFLVAVATLLLFASQVLAACSIETIGVNFGTYDPSAPSPTDSAGSVSYRCNRQDPITILLSRGNAPTFNPRQMLNGTEVMTYNLYRDATRTAIWGDGTGGTSVFADPAPPGRNETVTISIFGRIPPGQDVAAGTYSDNITATVNW